MDDPGEDFQRIVTAVVVRYCAQMSHRLSRAEVQRFAVQLSEVVANRGLPPPLKGDECGIPGGMNEAECAVLIERVTGGLTGPVWRDVAKQFVKACFYPEFKVCRDSFREVSRDGVCRRQELARVRSRISGTHCVDCPHWVALTADGHVEFLMQEWRSEPHSFHASQEIFLPEDFRALRRWLHAAARRGAAV